MKNKKMIERIFKYTQNDLHKWLHRSLTDMGYNPVDSEKWLYAEGEYPVMLIAHLDTVHREPVKQICYSDDHNVMMSPQGIGGDDRCGVYMVMQIAKKLNCHLLFCHDEEVGGRGASAFTNSGIKPNVNYLVEFDRKGSNDAVFYDCENDEFTEFVTSHGFTKEFGSYSDICTVAPYIGVAAVNISSGYYNAHTQHEYVIIDEMERNINRVHSMILETTSKYEYVEKPFSYKSGLYDYSKYYGGYYSDYYGDYYGGANNRKNSEGDEHYESGKKKRPTLKYVDGKLKRLKEVSVARAIMPIDKRFGEFIYIDWEETGYEDCSEIQTEDCNYGLDEDNYLYFIGKKSKSCAELGLFWVLDSDMNGIAFDKRHAEVFYEAIEDYYSDEECNNIKESNNETRNMVKEWRA